ncbi:MAG: preprotein translocase subunit YajC [Succinivibrionaceae bacterium]|jgi:preprotein translocase subunit YajC|nr:preprotein translocase subunit YajC [Succinivibrionaceae bacterium]
MDLFAVANAAETAAPAQEAAGFGSMIILVVVFIAVMYFVTVLPNKKAMKEKQNLLSQIAVGDEVQIRSGICGKLIEYKQDSEFAVIEISKGVPVTINKDYIMNVLPKGTISSLK